MASLIFTSALDDEARGAIDFDTDAFKCLLVTSAYTPNKGTHTKRSDVTDEVVGIGYVAGGADAVVTVAKDTLNHRINIELGAAIWAAPSTITARGAVYYKSRGGAPNLDELVAYIDFGNNVVSTAGIFSLSASVLRIQN